jgi:2-polyprenyl-3-methyl-5-hydroxy-6-metoxy-1,4-benzoquinol methylase
MMDLKEDIMSTPQSKSEPKQQANPAVIFETLHRYQHTMALKGAIDLELFTHVASGATTSAELAARCRASERGVRILCDYLAILGFLHKTGGAYHLSHESAVFLDKQSPAYLGSAANFLAHPKMLSHFRDVAELVRTGRPLAGAGNMEPENDLWVEFATSMSPLAGMAARIAAPIIAEPGRAMRVLDIAAGHGLFGISVARYNAAAEIVAVDWKNVLAVASENAARFGVQDRYQILPGDVFEIEFGSGYDLVMIPNFLHCFDPETNGRLLRKVRAAIKSNGRVATIELVPNEDRISPPIPASFSMNMLGATESGDAYTLRQLEQMFRDADLGESRVRTLHPTPLTLILTSR